MAFDIRQSTVVLQSYLMAAGWFEDVVIGEFKRPPNEGFVAALFNGSSDVVSTTLSSTVENHVVVLRIYRNMTDEPQEEIEVNLSQLVSQIADSFIADFTLGGEIRNIDFAGAHGTSMIARWAYEEIGGTVYRLVDLTVPMIVDGTATFAS